MKTKAYYGIMVLNAYSLGILMSVFSLVFLSKGLDLKQVAIVMGVYSASVIVLEFPTGVIADTMGRKKTFCLALLVNIVAYACLLFGRNLPILCAVTALIGMGRALGSGSLEALFIDQYTEHFGKERLPNAVTGQSVCEGAGLAAGALTGGLFPQLSYRFLPLGGAYDLNILLKLVLTAAILVLAFLFVQEDAPRAGVRSSFARQIKTSLLAVAGNRTLLLVDASLFAGGYFLSTLEAYWQPRFLSLVGSSMAWMLGVLAFLYFACSMLGNLASQRILERTRADGMGLYISSRVILAAVLFVLAWQNRMVPFTFFYSLVYIVFGAANIVENVLVNDRVPSNCRASVLSLNSLILQSGSLVAAFFSSLLISRTSISVIWTIAAAVVLTATLIMLLFRAATRGDAEAKT